MNSGVIDSDPAQGQLAGEQRNDSGVHRNAIGLKVGRLPRGFPAMDHQTARFKMKGGKLPGEGLEFHLAAAHALQFGDDFFPQQEMERVAVQINGETGEGPQQHKAGDDPHRPEAALPFWWSRYRSAHCWAPLATLAPGGEIFLMWAWERRVSSQ